ncbi:uncharacterized protein L203_102618 [Cryptococcus depauperatus CBS 7841]|uniref:Uncharacterized protein n=1 Tax=Cryptococcus depauperatus CBS 7841 TaxID=1295531 RepID=A0AAJ8JS36_9TREE
MAQATVKIWQTSFWLRRTEPKLAFSMKHNDEGAYTDPEIVDTLTIDGLALGRIKHYDRHTKGSIVGAKHLFMLDGYVSYGSADCEYLCWDRGSSPCVCLCAHSSFYSLSILAVSTFPDKYTQSALKSCRLTKYRDKVSIGFYSGTPGIIRNPNTLLSEFTDTDAFTYSLAKDFGAKGNSCSVPVVCEKLGFVCDLTDGVMETWLLLLCFSIASCLSRYERFLVPPLDFLPMPKMNARKIIARILVAATNANRLSLKSDFYTAATLAYGSVLLCN